MNKNKTLAEIDAELDLLIQKRQQKLYLQKKRELRLNAMQQRSARNVENQIKYMIGGVILKIWGKLKTIETLEKTKMTDSQRKTVEDFTRNNIKQIKKEIDTIGDKNLQKSRSDLISSIIERNEQR